MALPDRRRRWVASTWVSPLLVIIIAFLCSQYLYQLLLIQGDSMLPAYHHLQLAVVDKRNPAFQQGDVIAFRCEALSAVLVKRVVACPGDRVFIDEGTLSVNGETSRVYADEGAFEYAGLLSEVRILADGEYIVIGDNIARSKDSRYPEVGIVRRTQILGRVAWPVKTAQTVKGQETDNRIR